MYQEGLVRKINESEMPPYIVVEKNLPHICATLDEIGIPDDEYNCKFLLCCFLKTYLDGLQGAKDALGVLRYALSKMQNQENLKEGIAALTRLSGYSQSHLTRLTREHFDMSLKQYINELRLEAAYKDIMLTDKRIEDIAFDVGFASVSHFNKLVKERFGTTPAALRKNGGMR
jgi:AraC-like DNA-binding protein